MPAMSDLTTISALYGELRSIDAALGNFAAGGVIISMTISGGPLIMPPPAVPAPGLPFQPPRMPVAVTTTALVHPPAMIEAIRQQFEARKTAIAQELGTLGITGAAA